jgi:hypothetical protein
MALILGVSTGSKIYVGDIPVDITEAVPNSDEMSVAVDGGPIFVISDQESTEALPNVFLSVGRSKKQDAGGEKVIPRVVIEAPRDIVILRAELYDRQKS